MQLVDTGAEANRTYLESLGRAFAGAIIFSLPLMMTMEMWSLGFYLERWRLLQFIFFNFVLLVGLSRVSGFEPTVNWIDDLLDALAAYAVGVFASAAALAIFAIIVPGMPWADVIGKIAIQSVPASFGAMIASKQLSGGGNGDLKAGDHRGTYRAQLLLMLAGALFFGFNVAPTEEMVLISYRMRPGNALILVAVSIVLLHALVYSVGFKGQEEPTGAEGFWSIFFRFSVVGYGVAVLASLYALWTFGRIDGASPPQVASMVAVLGFPCAIGAAIGRLVV